MNIELGYPALETWMNLENAMRKGDYLKPLNLNTEEEEELLGWARQEWLRHVREFPDKVSIRVEAPPGSEDIIKQVLSSFEDKLLPQVQRDYTEAMFKIFSGLVAYRGLLHYRDDSEDWKRD